MKIKVNKEALDKCLLVVSSALPSGKSTMPIYDNFLLGIRGDKLHVCANNGKLQVKGMCAVESKEDFNMCIPGSVFMNTIRLLSEEEISLNYNADKFVLNISANKKKYKITGVNPKQFGVRKVNDDDKLSIRCLGSQLMPHIKAASSLVDWNDAREQMQGITIKTIKGEVAVAGSFGSVMVYFAKTGIKVDKEFAIIIPKDISMAISNSKGIGELDIEIGEKAISMSIIGFNFFSVLVNVSKVLAFESLLEPYKKDEYLVVDKGDMVMAARRLKSFSLADDSGDSIMIIEVKGKVMEIRAENSLFGRDGSESVDVVNRDVEDILIGVDVNKLITLLSTIEHEKIYLRTLAHMRPIAFYPVDSDNEQSWLLAPMDTDKLHR